MAVKISVQSENNLADSPFRIIVENLPQKQTINIRLTLENYYNINAPMNLPPQVTWTSEALFESDENGQIDLSKAPALSGAYQGISEMGLFFNARPNSHKKIKLAQSLADIPLNKDFQVKIEVLQNKELLAEYQFSRFYQEKNVAVENLYFPNAQGRLFYHSELGKRPAIMIVSGSEGRIEKAQNIAQLLAGRGFTCLSLAYFGLDGLSPNLSKIPLEAIEEALAYLKGLNYVEDEKIGLYGRSKGAEFTLLAAKKFKDFRCLVLNSPSSLVYEGLKGHRNSKTSSWTFRGEEIPYQPFKWGTFLKKMLFHKDDFEANPASRIEVSQLDIPLLMLASENDEIWQAKKSTEEIFQNYAKGKADYKIYQETGHMLTVAYQANERYSKRNSEKLLSESVDSWSKTVKFFSTLLK